jgi:hypothetical protein
MTPLLDLIDPGTDHLVIPYRHTLAESSMIIDVTEMMLLTEFGGSTCFHKLPEDPFLVLCRGRHTFADLFMDITGEWPGQEGLDLHGKLASLKNKDIFFRRH